MAPFFSVVIAAFNRGEMLRSALTSIRLQSFEDFECLMVDDGSTDIVPEVLREFSGDPRFQILGSRLNQGMNAARNMAIERARGEFVTFLDSDDFWLPGRLAAFHERAAASPEAGFLFSNAYVLRFGRLIGALFDPNRPIPEGVLPGHYAIGDRHLPYLTTNVAIRREAFQKWGGFKAGLKATDTELFARFLSRGLPVAAIKRPLAVRRLHENQITAGHAENFRQTVASFESSGAPAEELRRLREEAVADVALCLIKAGRPAEARAFLTEAAGPAGRKLTAWRLSYVPSPVLRGLASLRALYLRARHHPLFLDAERRAAERFIAPLLEEEAAGPPPSP